MDADALFLNQKVRCVEPDLQTRRQRDRSERAVRRQLSVEHVGEGRDAAHLGDAASVGEVGLHDGDAGLQRSEELIAGEEALAGGDRNRR